MNNYWIDKEKELEEERNQREESIICLMKEAKIEDNSEIARAVGDDKWWIQSNSKLSQIQECLAERNKEIEELKKKLPQITLRTKDIEKRKIVIADYVLVSDLYKLLSEAEEK